MKKMKMKKSLFYLFTITTVFTGCSTSLNSVIPSSNKTINATTKVEYQKLFARYEEENKTDDLLWDYEAGTVGYYIGAFNDSVKYFDEAEKLIKKYDEEIMASKIMANIGATLTNDTFMDYRPKIYEKILVNTYKGIDFVNLDNLQYARVEFNRALVRQDRAKDFFAKEIKKEKEKLNKQAQSKLKDKKVNNFDINSIVNNKKTLDPIEKKYSNLFAFKAYPDFVNPFVSYISGIFFLNQGDYNKATDLLKETYGMIKGVDEGADYVLSDFKLADKMKGSITARNQKYVWVVFFNGQGPIKDQIKIDVPLFLFTNKVHYTGIALPTIKTRNKAYPYLNVSNGKQNVKTKCIASMDRIVKTEFKKRFPLIVTRAITRTVIQTLIQSELQKRTGYIGGILGAVYQGVMNKADTRIWKTLPKEFDIAKIKSGGEIEITTPEGKKVFDIKTSPNNNYIIFVTIPTSHHEPMISYKRF